MIVIASALLFVLWMLGKPYLVERRRTQLRSRPFPRAWSRILTRRVPYFLRLPADLQIQLKKHIQVFLAEKPFIGCRGLTVTDEIRVTVAAQACLLILNRPRSDYYPSLRQILVYPGAFIVDKVQPDGAGVSQNLRQVLSGESWSQGQVILSWEDTLEGASVVDDGHNVVIHEFAHQLDQETGHANGAPFLPGRRRLSRFSQVFNDEFNQLQEQVRSQQPSLFGEYAATNPAEFFAVASEVFFEQPQRMASVCPALYRELGSFYRVNPLSW